MIRITGLPAGVAADVRITGPGNNPIPVTGTVTLPNLPPGLYAVAANAIAVGTTTYNPSVQNPSVTVTAGSAAQVNVVYTAVVPATGTLNVVVNGLPGGVAADAHVNGPGAANLTLQGSTVLSNLAVGPYTVTANPVTTGNATFNPTPTAAGVTVSGNTTSTVTIAYAQALPTYTLLLEASPGGTGIGTVTSQPGVTPAIDCTYNGATTNGACGPFNYPWGTRITLTATAFPGSQFIAWGGLTCQGSGPCVLVMNQSANVSAGFVLGATPTGTLQLAINGLPAGVNADVRISGPNGTSLGLQRGQEVRLQPGTYTVTANPVISGGTTYRPTVSSPTVEIRAGAFSAATVNYAP
ncbi:MAG: hypothetical protein ACOY71_02840 [Gemmatimonadota bacterium]